MKEVRKIIWYTVRDGETTVCVEGREPTVFTNEQLEARYVPPAPSANYDFWDDMRGVYPIDLGGIRDE